MRESPRRIRERRGGLQNLGGNGLVTGRRRFPDDARSQSMQVRPRRWTLETALMTVVLLLGACATTGSAIQTGPSTADQTRASDLPLIVTPTARAGDTFAVMYSGDSGWAPQAQAMASRLAADGVPVVGVDSVRYLIVRKTPERAAADLTAIVDRYSQTWGRSRVILIGYSFGGDVLPFIAARLSGSTLERVRLLALISPSDHGDLAFRGVSWFDWQWPGAKPLEPAIRALAGVQMICIHAEHDPRQACDRFPGDVIRPIRMPGGHRYDGRRDVVADIIAVSAGLSPDVPAP
jgi:type IV secretory pathway VirJ component